MGGVVRLLSLAFAVAGCDGEGHYRILVTFDPASAADQAAVVQVSLVPACPPEHLVGSPPAEALRSVEIREGASTSPLGAVPAGSYGLHVIARDVDCLLVAAGCAPVTVEAGGAGSFTVVALGFGGPGWGCSASERCIDAICVADDDLPTCSPDPDSCAVAGTLCGADEDCCTCSCGSGRCQGSGSGCEVAGEICDVDTDCCSGACVADVSEGGAVYRCGALESCRPAGEICGAPDSCCTAACDDGRCLNLDGCTVVGELCDADTDCCSGACAADLSAGQAVYRCAGLDGCLPSGELCGAPGDCCTLVCGQGRCGALEGCDVAGELCDVGADCCSQECESDHSAGSAVYRCG